MRNGFGNGSLPLDSSLEVFPRIQLVPSIFQRRSKAVTVLRIHRQLTDLQQTVELMINCSPLLTWPPDQPHRARLP